MNKLKEEKVNVRIIITTLWISIMCLYIYNDFFSLFPPGNIQEILDGMMGPFEVTQSGLFLAALLMLVPSLMIFLTNILPAKIAKISNMVLGVLYAFVMIGSLIGESWAFYIFLGIIEIVLSLLITWYAWKWPKEI
jgi:hypothetical protein